MRMAVGGGHRRGDDRCPFDTRQRLQDEVRRRGQRSGVAGAHTRGRAAPSRTRSTARRSGRQSFFVADSPGEAIRSSPRPRSPARSRRVYVEGQVAATAFELRLRVVKLPLARPAPPAASDRRRGRGARTSTRARPRPRPHSSRRRQSTAGTSSRGRTSVPGPGQAETGNGLPTRRIPLRQASTPRDDLDRSRRA